MNNELTDQQIWDILEPIADDHIQCLFPNDIVKAGRELLAAEYLQQNKKIAKCSCCGTTENLHKDFGSGGPYRCSSPSCVVF